MHAHTHKTGLDAHLELLDGIEDEEMFSQREVVRGAQFRKAEIKKFCLFHAFCLAFRKRS